MTDIPVEVVATSINDRGQVLLSSEIPGYNVIYSLESKTSTEIANFNGQTTFALNNLDQIVGCDPFGFNDGNLAATFQSGPLGTPTSFYFAPNTFSQPSAINDAGTIVGTIFVGTLRQGAMYQNGQQFSIRYPGATQTFPTGINDAGTVVGSYYGQSGPHGFVYQNGRYSTLDVPQTLLTVISGINNLGQIVGYYVGLLGVQRGFVYSGGKFTTINLPSYLPGTIFLTGINDEGQIVGYASIPGQPSPFVATPNYFTGF